MSSEASNSRGIGELNEEYVRTRDRYSRIAGEAKGRYQRIWILVAAFTWLTLFASIAGLSLPPDAVLERFLVKAAMTVLPEPTSP